MNVRWWGVGKTFLRTERTDLTSLFVPSRAFEHLVTSQVSQQLCGGWGAQVKRFTSKHKDVDSLVLLQTHVEVPEEGAGCGIRHPPACKHAATRGLGGRAAAPPPQRWAAGHLLVQRQQPGLPGRPAAGGPAAAVEEPTRVRASPLSRASSEGALSPRAPGLAARGCEPLSETGPGAASKRSAAGGLSGDRTEGHLCCWQPWHRGAGRGVDTSLSHVGGVAQGERTAPALSGGGGSCQTARSEPGPVP